jgi:hypothetical protein
VPSVAKHNYLGETQFLLDKLLPPGTKLIIREGSTALRKERIMICSNDA